MPSQRPSPPSVPLIERSKISLKAWWHELGFSFFQFSWMFALKMHWRKKKIYTIFTYKIAREFWLTINLICVSIICKYSVFALTIDSFFHPDHCPSYHGLKKCKANWIIFAFFISLREIAGLFRREIAKLLNQITFNWLKLNYQFVL